MDASTTQRIGPFFQFPVERLDRNYRSATASGRSSIRGRRSPTCTSPPTASRRGTRRPRQTLGVAPYVDPATNKGKLIDGFQIICAGEDKLFGSGGTNLPATGPGEDDIANFSQGTLGSAN